MENDTRNAVETAIKRAKSRGKWVEGIKIKGIKKWETYIVTQQQIDEGKAIKEAENA